MDKLKSFKQAIKLPYIKVKYREDDPVSGNKKGDVVPIAYRFFNSIPADKRTKFELVEGPETLQELKENQHLALQDMHDKLGAALGESEEPEEETEEEESEGEEKKKRKVNKKRKS